MPYRPKTHHFSFWIAASLCAHVALVGVCFLLALIGEATTREEKIIRVQILMKGEKKRDENLLPRVQPPKPDIPEPIKNSEPTPSQTEKPKPSEDEQPIPPQKHHIPKPPKEAQKKPPSGRENPLDVLKKHVQPAEREGDPNGFDFGNSAIGDLKDSYVAIVLARLHQNFRIPATIGANERANLSIKINLQIDADGKLVRFSIVSGSQNPDYDDAVQARVEEIRSFGPPPLPLRKELKRNGIDVEMCPDKCR